ncbi:MAG: chalcone isomerase family protein [Shewanella sp.]
MSSVRNRYLSRNLRFYFLNSSGFSLLALSFLMTPLQAKEVNTSGFDNITIDVNDSTDVTQTLLEVGRGEMDWLWFNLYKAKLMTPTGRYQQGQYPLVLDIEYYRDIESEDLLKATKDQWQHLAFAENDIQRWMGLLNAIWPDVKQGDHLSFKVIDGQTSLFFVNQQPLDMIHDANFAEAFLAIWLSKHTSRPNLRAQLLGEKSCDC